MAINVFSKFLDFIGLVDEPAAAGRDDDFDTAGNSRVRMGSTIRRKSTVVNDEFASEPRMARAQSQKERNAAPSNDQFDADEAWETRRPDYGARTQQRAQSNTRPSAGRYTAEGRTSTQNTRPSASRYDAAGFGESGHYSSYQSDSSYRTNVGSGYSTSPYGGRNTSSASYSSESMADQSASGNYQKHRIATFSIRTVDECKNVIRTLLEKKSVLLSLEDMDSLQAQRAVDTMSGATFAIGAKMNRASERSWLITPSTVEIDEGVQPQENSTFGTQYR